MVGREMSRRPGDRFGQKSVPPGHQKSDHALPQNRARLWATAHFQTVVARLLVPVVVLWAIPCVGWPGHCSLDKLRPPVRTTRPTAWSHFRCSVDSGVSFCIPGTPLPRDVYWDQGVAGWLGHLGLPRGPGCENANSHRRSPEFSTQIGAVGCVFVFRNTQSGGCVLGFGSFGGLEMTPPQGWPQVA